MIELSVQEIIKATGGKLLQGSKAYTIKGITIDSRKTNKSDLFIPLIGKRFNGHNFIKDAICAGATAILTSQWDESFRENKDINIIQVNNTLQALHDLARYYISKFNIPIVGVTGSTGKTTTKDMIYSVLTEKYKVLRNQGNFNNHIGLPMTVFQVESFHDVAVFEMGMSGFGEIDTLAKIVKPNIAVITNIGLSHIEHLGSQENILKAKMEITNYFRNKDVLVVNGDDRLLQSLQNNSIFYSIYYIGRASHNNLQAINIQDLGVDGSAFEILWDGKRIPLRLKVPGEHNIYNALCAIMVGILLDIDIELIQKGIQNFQGSKMRLNIFTTTNKIKVINDTYNASPDSMKAALSVLSKINANRKIAVLGDMLEMGIYSKDSHRIIGHEVVKHNVDILLVVGSNAREIANGAIEKGFQDRMIYKCNDNYEVIQMLKNLLQVGDAVLIKGSRGMRMEEIVEYIQERS